MSTGKGNTVEDFRRTYDKSLIVPEKIKAGLASLGDAWEHEADFIKRCGVSNRHFAEHREQFLPDYSVEVSTHQNGVRRRVWAGTKKFAAKLRAIADR